MSALKQESDWQMLILEICESVSKLTGNIMSEKQWPMVEARLRRRLLELKLTTPEEYRHYWKTNTHQENNELISRLTTHFTSFFREFPHFEWIAKELPQIVALAKREGRKTIKFWSAASSKGQEVWSLCMWLDYHLKSIDPNVEWFVYGSDIDQASVKEAENGVYHRKEIETAPRHLWEQHWVRGKNEIADWYKVKPSLRGHAKFFSMNLLNVTLPLNEKFDVIMCRNVLIYFDRANQEKIALSLLKHLGPSGTLITGMSESLSGFGLPIKGVAASVYKSANNQVTTEPLPKSTISSLVHPMPMKVLCVDDSPTVISILKKILKSPEFEIIGVASNGEEALRKLTDLKPDIITLDLHMPIMDGLEFLKVSGAARKFPVVVVSSVEREFTPLMAPLHEQGVCDFVEKPTLSNLDRMGEELIQKLKMAWTSKKSSHVLNSTNITSSYARPVGHIAFVASVKDKDNLIHVLKEQKWNGDELSFLCEKSDLDELKSVLNPFLKNASRVNFFFNAEELDLKKPSLYLYFKNGDIRSLKYGVKKMSFVILEEIFLNDSELRPFATDFSPVTSFSYLIDKCLRGNRTRLD